jgi:hypothetical protein
MQPRTFFADRALRLELAHRTVERRWIDAHRARDLADRDAGLRGHAFKHLLTSLTGFCQHAARSVIAYVDPKALRKLAQLAVFVDQRLELSDPLGEVSLEPAEIA